MTWNHNNHYHDFLLNYVPFNGVALDIGCGSGTFARRLAPLCQSVDAIDPDKQAITTGREASGAFPNLSFHCAPFEASLFPRAHYDFVSAIASVHHMPLASTIDQMKRLLKPNGTLAILGLYKEETIADFLWGVVAVSANNIYRYTKRQGEERGYQMVTSAPKMSLQAIRSTFDTQLPNHHFSRHLLWRYSVIWHKPHSQ